jgi:hypothetical protein
VSVSSKTNIGERELFRLVDFCRHVRISSKTDIWGRGIFELVGLALELSSIEDLFSIFL